jgi:DNA-nicking Smr family endonuclease
VTTTLRCRQPPRHRELDPHSPFAGLAAVKAELERKELAKKALPAKNSGGTGVATGKTAAYAAPKQSGTVADDSLSFARMMMGVMPLDTATNRVSSSTASAQTPGSVKPKDRQAELEAQLIAENLAVKEHLRQLADGTAKFEVFDDGKHLEGKRIDCNPALLRKLRRGQFVVDGRIDLHEMTAHEAQLALCDFLGRMRARGEGCVLVVHGKGEHSPHGVGILRGEIGAWLAQGKAAANVAAFASAEPAEGGHGATYVLLRR